MSHTGGKEGTYPGTRASATMIGDDETNWGTKSLAILDMPFTAAGCSRDVIRIGAERLGWELDRLFQMTIEAMRSCEAQVQEELTSMLA